MATEKTPKLNLTVYTDIDGVYQRELRQSYAENFQKIDAGIAKLETDLKAYVEKQLEVIENGYY